MNKRLKLSCLSLFLALVICSCSSQKKYSYETVPNDPLKARIYTLDNGLKIYLTVNKETPRIQTFIAVRVGGKNVNPEKPDVPLNKNDAFQKVQKRRVQEKR